MERLRDKGLFFVLLCLVFTSFFKDVIDWYIPFILGIIGIWSRPVRFASCIVLFAAFQLWQFDNLRRAQSDLGRCIHALAYHKVTMMGSNVAVLNYCNQASVKIYAKDIILQKTDHFWIHRSKLKTDLNFISKSDLIQANLNNRPAEAPLYLALIKGNSSELSEEHLDLFRAIGLGHFLALSGMHLAYGVLFLKLIFWGFRHRKWFQILELITLSSYLIFLGFPLSFTRAFAMYGIYVLAKLFQVKTSGLNIILILSVCSLLIWPEIVFNLSFQFSFLAVGSIVYLWPKREAWRWSLSKRGARLFNGIMDPVYAAFFAQIPLVGLSLYYFKQFAFGGIVVSVLMSPILSLLLMSYYILFVMELFGVQQIELQLWIQTHFMSFSTYFRKIGGLVEFSDFSENALMFSGLITLVLVLFLRTMRLKFALLFFGLSIHLNLFLNREKTTEPLHLYQSIFQNEKLDYVLIEDRFPESFSNNKKQVVHLKGNPKIHPGRLKGSGLVLVDYMNSPYLRKSWMRYFQEHKIPSKLIYGVPELEGLKKALEMRAF